MKIYGKYLDYVKLRGRRILIVEVRPVPAICDTTSQCNSNTSSEKTDKWMQYYHWQDLQKLLNELVEEYETGVAALGPTQSFTCDTIRQKTGKSVNIAYKWRQHQKCQCFYLSPADSSDSSDCSDDEDLEKQQRALLYRRLDECKTSDSKKARNDSHISWQPCGVVLCVSVAPALPSNCCEQNLPQDLSSPHSNEKEALVTHLQQQPYLKEVVVGNREKISRRKRRLSDNSNIQCIKKVSKKEVCDGNLNNHCGTGIYFDAKQEEQHNNEHIKESPKLESQKIMSMAEMCVQLKQTRASLHKRKNKATTNKCQPGQKRQDKYAEFDLISTQESNIKNSTLLSDSGLVSGLSNTKTCEKVSPPLSAVIAKGSRQSSEHVPFSGNFNGPHSRRLTSSLLSEVVDSTLPCIDGSDLHFKNINGNMVCKQTNSFKNSGHNNVYHSNCLFNDHKPFVKCQAIEDEVEFKKNCANVSGYKDDLKSPIHPSEYDPRYSLFGDLLNDEQVNAELQEEEEECDDSAELQPLTVISMQPLNEMCEGMIRSDNLKLYEEDISLNRCIPGSPPMFDNFFDESHSNLGCAKVPAHKVLRRTCSISLNSNSSHDVLTNDECEPYEHIEPEGSESNESVCKLVVNGADANTLTDDESIVYEVFYCGETNSTNPHYEVSDKNHWMRGGTTRTRSITTVKIGEALEQSSIVAHYGDIQPSSPNRMEFSDSQCWSSQKIFSCENPVEYQERSSEYFNKISPENHNESVRSQKWKLDCCPFKTEDSRHMNTVCGVSDINLSHIDYNPDSLKETDSISSSPILQSKKSSMSVVKKKQPTNGSKYALASKWEANSSMVPLSNTNNTEILFNDETNLCKNKNSFNCESSSWFSALQITDSALSSEPSTSQPSSQGGSVFGKYQSSSQCVSPSLLPVNLSTSSLHQRLNPASVIAPQEVTSSPSVSSEALTLNAGRAFNNVCIADTVKLRGERQLAKARLNTLTNSPVKSCILDKIFGFKKKTKSKCVKKLASVNEEQVNLKSIVSENFVEESGNIAESGALTSQLSRLQGNLFDSTMGKRPKTRIISDNISNTLSNVAAIEQIQSDLQQVNIFIDDTSGKEEETVFPTTHSSVTSPSQLSLHKGYRQLNLKQHETCHKITLTDPAMLDSSDSSDIYNGKSNQCNSSPKIRKAIASTKKKSSVSSEVDASEFSQIISQPDHSKMKIMSSKEKRKPKNIISRQPAKQRKMTDMFSRKLSSKIMRQSIDKDLLKPVSGPDVADSELCDSDEELPDIHSCRDLNEINKSLNLIERNEIEGIHVDRVAPESNSKTITSSSGPTSSCGATRPVYMACESQILSHELAMQNIAEGNIENKPGKMNRSTRTRRKPLRLACLEPDFDIPDLYGTLPVIPSQSFSNGTDPDFVHKDLSAKPSVSKVNTGVTRLVGKTSNKTRKPRAQQTSKISNDKRSSTLHPWLTENNKKIGKQQLNSNKKKVTINDQTTSELSHDNHLVVNGIYKTSLSGSPSLLSNSRSSNINKHFSTSSPIKSNSSRSSDVSRKSSTSSPSKSNDSRSSDVSRKSSTSSPSKSNDSRSSDVSRKSSTSSPSKSNDSRSSDVSRKSSTSSPSKSNDSRSSDVSRKSSTSSPSKSNNSRSSDVSRKSSTTLPSKSNNSRPSNVSRKSSTSSPSKSDNLVNTIKAATKSKRRKLNVNRSSAIVSVMVKKNTDSANNQNRKTAKKTGTGKSLTAASHDSMQQSSYLNGKNAEEQKEDDDGNDLNYSIDSYGNSVSPKKPRGQDSTFLIEDNSQLEGLADDTERSNGSNNSDVNDDLMLLLRELAPSPIEPPSPLPPHLEKSHMREVVRKMRRLYDPDKIRKWLPTLLPWLSHVLCGLEMNVWHETYLKGFAATENLDSFKYYSVLEQKQISAITDFLSLHMEKKLKRFLQRDPRPTHTYTWRVQVPLVATRMCQEVTGHTWEHCTELLLSANRAGALDDA